MGRGEEEEMMMMMMMMKGRKENISIFSHLPYMGSIKHFSKCLLRTTESLKGIEINL
jgi:hypothetical protein